MNKKMFVTVIGTVLLFVCGTLFAKMTDEEIAQKVNELMSKMTLQDKIGQLVQYSGTDAVTGPEGMKVDVLQEVKDGRVGSLFNVIGTEKIKEIQGYAVKDSKLGIPLIFGLDVIHGYKTEFPVPLAMASSWNMDAIKTAAHVAAKESAATGLNWTFAPMVDIARDPRWGRVVEGAGEDPYLGSCIAKAQVEGFQGDDMSAVDTVLACVKHYLAYGAAEAGREYNTTDVSDIRLREIYLPPFQAAIEAGVGTVMSAFNALNDVPMTGNKKWINGVLKHELGFKGFVVSDWTSISEMINHGYAKDSYQAAELAFDAGVDMDMVSGCYDTQMAKLIKDGKITEAQVDDAVKRILTVKYKLGLFEDPYKYCDAEREKTELLSKENREAARAVAKESIVLLKNEDSVLPIKKDIKTIAVIGPLGDSKADMLGPWTAQGEAKDCVTILEGIKSKISSGTEVLYAKGCDINSDKTDDIQEAVETAKKADVVIASVGEAAEMSGEAAARAYLDLPGKQKDLLQALKKTGKPVIVVLSNGRPLILNWINENFPAIVETWFLGTEAGNAIADVLFGDYNPSGKLTMTFPYAVGQIPIYYDHFNTGRPYMGDNNKYCSKYIDIPNAPLYPFGYGLSYTTFKYSDIELSADKINKEQNLKASVEVTNTGNFDGKETVQVYIRDIYASTVQPVKRLIDFKQITLKTGETQKLTFEVTPDKLEIFNSDLEKVLEPGQFKLFIGTSSDDVKEADFEVID